MTRRGAALGSRLHVPGPRRGSCLSARVTACVTPPNACRKALFCFARCSLVAASLARAHPALPAAVWLRCQALRCCGHEAGGERASQSSQPVGRAPADTAPALLLRAQAANILEAYFDVEDGEVENLAPQVRGL